MTALVPSENLTDKGRGQCKFHIYRIASTTRSGRGKSNKYMHDNEVKDNDMHYTKNADLCTVRACLVLNDMGKGDFQSPGLAIIEKDPKIRAITKVF